MPLNLKSISPANQKENLPGRTLSYADICKLQTQFAALFAQAQDEILELSKKGSATDDTDDLEQILQRQNEAAHRKWVETYEFPKYTAYLLTHIRPKILYPYKKKPHAIEPIASINT